MRPSDAPVSGAKPRQCKMQCQIGAPVDLVLFRSPLTLCTLDDRDPSRVAYPPRTDSRLAMSMRIVLEAGEMGTGSATGTQLPRRVRDARRSPLSRFVRRRCRPHRPQTSVLCSPNRPFYNRCSTCGAVVLIGHERITITHFQAHTVPFPLTLTSDTRRSKRQSR